MAAKILRSMDVCVTVEEILRTDTECCKSQSNVEPESFILC